MKIGLAIKTNKFIKQFEKLVQKVKQDNETLSIYKINNIIYTKLNYQMIKILSQILDGIIY